MSITDELRKWGYGFCGDTHNVVTAIADRIDAEHDKALNSVDGAYDSGYNVGYDEGFASADDWLGQHEDAMAEHGWVRLPKDADGEPIHIGDVLQWPEDGDTFEVIGIGEDGVLFYFDPDTEGETADWTASQNKRHYHAPTVKDVLHELVADWADSFDAEGKDEVLTEYAAKLRLADDGEGQ